MRWLLTLVNVALIALYGLLLIAASLAFGIAAVLAMVVLIGLLL